MRAISVETRENIIGAKRRGEKIEDIIKWFNIGRRTIYNLIKRYKESGTCVPLPFTGRKTKIFTEEVKEKIRLKVKENPSITQEGIIEELSLGVTQAALSKQMKKMGITLKKNNIPYRKTERRCYYKKGRMEGKTKRIRYKQIKVFR